MADKFTQIDPTPPNSFAPLHGKYTYSAANEGINVVFEGGNVVISGPHGEVSMSEWMFAEFAFQHADERLNQRYAVKAA